MDRARAVGVTGILVPGVSPDTWSRTLALRARYPEVRVALGVHPQSLPSMEARTLALGLDSLEARLRDEGAAAVGECGLDGLTARRGGVPLDTQARVLRAHLAIAARLALPVVLHCYKAHGRMLALLEAHGPLRGVLHAYSGSAELIPRYAALGLHFGFGGAITWPNARRPVAAAAAAPADRILLETDAPDQLPHPRDRERNEPCLLPRIAARMAEIRGGVLPENTL